MKEKWQEEGGGEKIFQRCGSPCWGAKGAGDPQQWLEDANWFGINCVKSGDSRHQVKGVAAF